MHGSPTLIDVVRLSTEYLGRHGSPSARLDSELLTAHALGLRRLDLYLQFDRTLAGAELEAARALLRRRAAGEPVAYLTGQKEFYGRGFHVTPDVLIPRPETESLIDRALVWARDRAGPRGAGLTLDDVGTGSGCIAVTLAAELCEARLLATDVSAAALAVARENAEALGVAARVHVLEGRWGDGLPAVDAVVSNPPYVTTDELAGVDRDVREYEPRGALDGGSDGLDAYRSLLPSVADAVRGGGYVGLEVDPRRAAAVADLATATWPGARVTVTRDLSGRDRVVGVSNLP